MKSLVLRTLILFLACMPLTGCFMADQLKEVGQAPKFTPIKDPFSKRPASYEMYQSEGIPSHPHTLWAPGKKSFFRDQRAHRRGDILTVIVKIAGEKASLENKTNRKRTSANSYTLENFFGQQASGIVGATPAMSVSSKPDFSGEGKVDRKESVDVQISVVVKEVLPNGNLVIEGRQEVRLNFEIREIFISGIVRPQDINNDNTVQWNRIAEARVGYGGRGQITQFMQPPYGQQVLDILMPF